MKSWKNSLARCLLATFASALIPIFTPALACPPQAPAQQAAQAEQATSEREVGFLLAAPDRGFMGNEEIRDAFEAFRQQHNAALLVVTDGRTRDNARAALATLASQGAKRVVLLPLFYSAGEARYSTLRAALDGAGGLPLTWAPVFGSSYFAVEALAGRLRTTATEGKAKGQQLIVVGSGAADQAGAARIAADLRNLAQHASAGLGYTGIAAAVWPDSKSGNEQVLRKAALAALHTQPGALVAQLHLGQKLDSMMALDTRIKHALPADSRLLAEQPLTPLALTWMRREANRQLPLAANQIGVVVAAHGSDWHWNETMQSAVRPLEQRYQVEYAFSMADAPVLERAVRRLEQRGVRAIVIVRVFGSKTSFKREIEHLIGQDIEAPADEHAQHNAGHDHGGHGHAASGPVARISSAAVLSSAGGLEDHPLFAQALTERAKALSQDPRRTTVILTAHGTNDDGANAKWLEQLTSIAAGMKANMAAAGDAAFREIRVATWREDWPEKRAPWVERVRGWVEQASRDGEVIVIAARTNGTGPEAELLSGLKFRLGSGFAPHPLFARWVEEQVQAGLNQRTPAASTSIASAATANTAHSAKQPQQQHQH